MTLSNSKLIWDSKYITNERIYKGVQSIYRYGCGICRRYGQQITHKDFENPNNCDDCLRTIKENNEETDDLLLEHLIQNISSKRSREDSDSDGDENKKLKEDGELSDETDDESDEMEKEIEVLDNLLQDGRDSDVSVDSTTSTITPMDQGQ